MSPSLSPRPAGAPLRVGLLGFGTVGAGLHQVLAAQQRLLQRRSGRAIEIAMLGTRTPARARGRLAPAVVCTDDPWRVVREPAVDVVVELIGGCEPARALVLEAIARGKHVVTANKALLALHGPEIAAAARRHGVGLGFEAAVAGCVPIVKALREGLAGNQVHGLAGILNGTSHYLLSRMAAEGCSFAAALAEAQRLGYAEADPTLDIGGHDAAHKLTLLARLAFGDTVPFGAVEVRGLAGLAAEDLQHTARLGWAIKPLAVARRDAAGLRLRVGPALVPQRSLLGTLDGAMNAVLVHSQPAGTTAYLGAGAGAAPTASAVVADLVDLARRGHEPWHAAADAAGDAAEPAAAATVPLPSDRSPHYLRLRLGPGGTGYAQALQAAAATGVGLQTACEAGDGAQPPAAVMLTVPIDAAAGEALRAALRPLVHADADLQWLAAEPLAALP